MASARRFVGDTPGEAITKALGPTRITDNGRVKVAYTRRLMTVIGQQMFPVAIHTDTEDARADPDALRYEKVSDPTRWPRRCTCSGRISPTPGSW